MMHNSKRQLRNQYDYVDDDYVIYSDFNYYALQRKVIYSEFNNYAFQLKVIYRDFNNYALQQKVIKNYYSQISKPV